MSIKMSCIECPSYKNLEAYPHQLGGTTEIVFLCVPCAHAWRLTNRSTSFPMPTTPEGVAAWDAVSIYEVPA